MKSISYKDRKIMLKMYSYQSYSKRSNLKTKELEIKWVSSFPTCLIDYLETGTNYKSINFKSTSRFKTYHVIIR